MEKFGNKLLGIFHNVLTKINATILTITGFRHFSKKANLPLFQTNFEVLPMAMGRFTIHPQRGKVIHRHQRRIKGTSLLGLQMLQLVAPIDSRAVVRHRVFK
ncbi:MAG: hypothetical protein DRR19_23775 [Candidatus Parabeggiatoa sp. nov. 1]|nr:MAG: hypothetical protein DRR19_23775 [Gammaproteobacteria bacterium]